MGGNDTKFMSPSELDEKHNKEGTIAKRQKKQAEILKKTHEIIRKREEKKQKIKDSETKRVTKLIQEALLKHETSIKIHGRISNIFRDYFGITDPFNQGEITSRNFCTWHTLYYDEAVNTFKQQGYNIDAEEIGYKLDPYIVITIEY